MAVRQPLPYRFVLVAFTVLALLVASAPGVSLRPAQAKEPPVEVYASIVDGKFDGTSFTALDPDTLEDLGGHPVVDFGSGVGPGTSGLSADGSTFVAVVGDDFDIVVRDGFDGPERARFSAGGAAHFIALSEDGARVVLEVFAARGGDYTQIGELKVFDTSNGELTATLQSDDPSGSYGTIVVDDDATRLYRFVVARDEADRTMPKEPRPGRLIAYDLTTGVEIGRLDLPEVMAGAWQREDGGLSHLDPAIALSGDGRLLAIAHADEEAVTVVSTWELEVTQTVALAHPRSWVQRLLGMVPLLPQDASAKAFEGITLQGVFAPDGRHLWLYGTEGVVNDDGQMEYQGLGLRIVNVESGTIEASVLDDARIQAITSTPYGGSLYVTGTKSGHISTTTIWRLDGYSLELLAERSLKSHGYVPSIFLQPVAEP